MSRKTDIVKQEYKCPRCSGTLQEKIPSKDKLLIKKLLIVRLFCVCGYYQDISVKTEDIKN